MLVGRGSCHCGARDVQEQGEGKLVDERLMCGCRLLQAQDLFCHKLSKLLWRKQGSSKELDEK
jgi:hypothetical protein